MARQWIQKATKAHKGLFRRKARANDMTTRAYANAVLANKPTRQTPTGRYTQHSKRQARLALRLMRMSRRRRRK